MEETGYQCQKVIPLGPPFWLSTRNSWSRYWPFLGIEAKKVSGQKLGAFEDIELELFSLERWIELAQTIVEDHCAVTTTFRALPSLEQYLKPKDKT